VGLGPAIFIGHIRTPLLAEAVSLKKSIAKIWENGDGLFFVSLIKGLLSENISFSKSKYFNEEST